MHDARIGSSTILFEPDGEDTMATIREQIDTQAMARAARMDASGPA